MKPNIRKMARQVLCDGHRLGRIIGLNRSPTEPVCFVTEKADWAIRWVGEYIKQGIDSEQPELMTLTSTPANLSHRVVHFGSQYMWLGWERHMPRSNRYVTSFFHGKPEDGPDVARHIDEFLESTDRLSKIVVGASLVERRLIDWGVDKTKIAQIPIGCDTMHFRPPTMLERRLARKRLGVPDGAVCIGSFQKDGVGWGDGMKPKMIKGPDVFIEAIRRLSIELPVFVLLTGPARGYVKAGLEKLGISYRHDFLDNYRDIAEYYHVLDLYMVTSREEGGPMALMESMASHVPVVTTRVGQAEDLIDNGKTGEIVETEDIDGLCAKSLQLLERDSDLILESAKAARQSVVDGFDWAYVARQHLDKVYRPLVAEI